MKVMAQMAMVMNLDKCIGCHTCSVTCKQAWTNRTGTEYVWFNNVETRPGQGYPRRYEDQEEWKGGWTLNKRGRLTLKARRPAQKLLTIFSNPKMPSIQDYYEPWTYDYATLTDAPGAGAHAGGPAEVAAHRQGHEDRPGRRTGTTTSAARRRPSTHDPMLAEGRGQGEASSFEQTFMFYLPRICEHCLNPSCAASCPSGAIYKRSEDGIVLVDQDRCRGWRMCVSGCPYKKVYFNHRTGKAEKCTFCFPRIEVGLPTVCAETCVGRLRYIGLVLYDADKVLEAASTSRRARALRGAARGVPRPRTTPRSQREAERAGIPHDWVEAAQRSPDPRADQPVQGRAAAAPGVPHDADGLVHPAALAGGRRGQGDRRGRRGRAATCSPRSTRCGSRSSTSPSSSPPATSRRSTRVLQEARRDALLHARHQPGPRARRVDPRGRRDDARRRCTTCTGSWRSPSTTSATSSRRRTPSRRTRWRSWPPSARLDYDGGPGMGGSGPSARAPAGPTPIAVENFQMLQDRQTSDTIASPDDKACAGQPAQLGRQGHPAAGCSRRRTDETPDEVEPMRPGRAGRTLRRPARAPPGRSPRCCSTTPTRRCSTGSPLVRAGRLESAPAAVGAPLRRASTGCAATPLPTSQADYVDTFDTPAALQPVPHLLRPRRHPQARDGAAAVQADLPARPASSCADARAARPPVRGAGVRRHRRPRAPGGSCCSTTAPGSSCCGWSLTRDRLAAGPARSRRSARRLPAAARRRGRGRPPAGRRGAARGGGRPHAVRRRPARLRIVPCRCPPSPGGGPLMDVFLWVIVPYLCLATFVVGHFWRYRYDKFGWTTRSSQLYEDRLLRLGSARCSTSACSASSAATSSACSSRGRGPRRSGSTTTCTTTSRSSAGCSPASGAGRHGDPDLPPAHGRAGLLGDHARWTR